MWRRDHGRITGPGHPRRHAMQDRNREHHLPSGTDAVWRTGIDGDPARVEGHGVETAGILDGHTAAARPGAHRRSEWVEHVTDGYGVHAGRPTVLPARRECQ